MYIDRDSEHMQRMKLLRLENSLMNDITWFDEELYSFINLVDPSCGVVIVLYLTSNTKGKK